MALHKFAVGQIVDFDRKFSPSSRATGPYEVTRVLPAEDASSQTYCIKSRAEPFERSAMEYEIVAVSSPATELASIFGEAAGADRTRRSHTLTTSVGRRAD
jgi:hypothetical protein